MKFLFRQITNLSANKFLEKKNICIIHKIKKIIPIKAEIIKIKVALKAQLWNHKENKIELYKVPIAVIQEFYNQVV